MPKAPQYGAFLGKPFFVFCEAPMAPRRGNPRRGFPRPETVHRTDFGLPLLRFALHYAGACLLGTLRGIPRLLSRLVGSAPETPAAF